MAKKMTRDEFWGVVAELGWDMKGDYEAGKKFLLEKFPTYEGAEEYSEHLGDVFDKLYKNQVDWCQENWEKRTTDCGDDGFSDLLHHVVGLGKEEYDRAMEDPWLVVKRARSYDFMESFAYCTPYDRDYAPTNFKLAEARSGLEYWEWQKIMRPDYTAVSEVERRTKEVEEFVTKLASEGGEEMTQLDFMTKVYRSRARAVEVMQENRKEREDTLRRAKALASLTDEQIEALGL